MIFMHMPTPEYLDAFNDYDYYGVKNGLVSCASTNTGLFDLITSNNFVQGMTVGHDVRNSYYSYVGDVFLHYGRSTGGLGMTTDMVPGARVFNVSKNKNNELMYVQTWIRLSNGSKLEESFKAVNTVREAQDECLMPTTLYDSTCQSYIA